MSHDFKDQEEHKPVIAIVAISRALVVVAMVDVTLSYKCTHVKSMY